MLLTYGVIMCNEKHIFIDINRKYSVLHFHPQWIREIHSKRIIFETKTKQRVVEKVQRTHNENRCEIDLK